MSQESGGWGVAHMCTALGFYIVTVSMKFMPLLHLFQSEDLQVTGFVEVH